ncbi:hypothetical protein MMO39_12950 [Acinetobacter modestus]|uniref:hypothetical protein n=1 Tax=Acinetobacter modestus TaxID=1776740 RepID=UPI001F4B46B4|nr:hypothetical protein [Acinetobacter modestus]MCH7388197.1 hypothetical protein [Acinetobacter modestus]
MSFSDITGDWDIYIDQMETPTISDNIGSAIYQLNDLYPDKLDGSYDGFIYMANTDSIPHRFKFVPIPNSGASFTANTEENLTFMTNDDGGFTFCLAPGIIK